ncbi:MAG: hypothetical protein ABIZ04_18260 [Opitutus sp.]
MQDALLVAQAASPALDPNERDASFAELEVALERISRRDIEAFCGVCLFRNLALPWPDRPLALQRASPSTAPTNGFCPALDDSPLRWAAYSRN